MEATGASSFAQAKQANTKGVVLRGASVFVCTMGFTRKLEPARVRGTADVLGASFDARFRTCRWRAVRQWRLVTTVRPAVDGRADQAQVDMYLIVARDHPGRADNVYATWRARCV
jgi:hypothetical protein